MSKRTIAGAMECRLRSVGMHLAALALLLGATTAACSRSVHVAEDPPADAGGVSSSNATAGTTGESRDTLRYELVLGKKHALCRDVSTLMNSGALPPTNNNYCTWRFHPNLDGASKLFRLPVWERVDQSKYLDFSKQAYEVPLVYWGARQLTTSKSRWEEEHRARYEALIQEQQIHYYTSWFDLDGNGDKEHVLLQDILDCADSPLSYANRPDLPAFFGRRIS